MMRYSVVSRLLHWIMAILILATIPIGLTMTQEGLDRPLQDTLFILHKGIGSLLLVLIALRILWRLARPVPPLPSTLPRAQRIAAQVVHLGLYVFVAIQAVSGYVRVTTGGFPIELLNAVGVPPLLPENEAVAEVASAIHATAIIGLLGLLTLHIGAALYHLLIARDGVFQRMWPPFALRATPRR